MITLLGDEPDYSSDVSVLLGRGDGTFGRQARFLAGAYPTSLVIGNFNGNQRPDIAVVNLISKDIWILLNQGNAPVGATVQPR